MLCRSPGRGLQATPQSVQDGLRQVTSLDRVPAEVVVEGELIEAGSNRARSVLARQRIEIGQAVPVNPARSRTAVDAYVEISAVGRPVAGRLDVLA